MRDDVPEDHERVQRLLGEFRMMVTAVGVLVAFQLQAVFSSGFRDVSLPHQRAHVVGTLVGIAAFACFLIPPSVHRITSQVRNAERFILFARRTIAVGFVLLAVALILGIFVQASATLGDAWGYWSAGGTTAMLIVAWSLIPRWFAHVVNDE